MIRNGISRLWHPLFEHLSGCDLRGILHGVPADGMGLAECAFAEFLTIDGCNIE